MWPNKDENNPHSQVVKKKECLNVTCSAGAVQP